MSARASDRLRERRGAEMSTKQIAEAAVRGRKVTFGAFSHLASKVSGYVVGMDDYHWLVAVPVKPEERSYPQENVRLMLVHKTAAECVTLHSEETLKSEPPSTREALEKVGSAFWTHIGSMFPNRKN